VCAAPPATSSGPLGAGEGIAYRLHLSVVGRTLKNNTCKHEVAAALVLRQSLAAPRPARRPAPSAARRPRPGPPTRSAAGRSRNASSRPGASICGSAPRHHRSSASKARPGSPTGAAAGGPEGPHSCDCPDFEANRLHTCKHVERARLFLRSRAVGRCQLPARSRAAPDLPALRRGGRAAALRDGRGARSRGGARGVRRRRPSRPPPGAGRGRSAPLARRARAPRRAGGDRLARRSPAPQARTPNGKFARLLPPLPLSPYPYQWTGAEFLARTGRALLATRWASARRCRRSWRPRPSAGRAACPQRHRRLPGQPARRLAGRDPPLAGRGGDPPWRAGTGTRPDDRLAPSLAAHTLRAGTARPSRASGTPARSADRGRGTARQGTAHPDGPRPQGHRRALRFLPHRHALENRLEEAYAIAQLIDQRLLPPLWQIDRDHFVRDDKGRRVVLYRGLDALRSRLAPAFLRRRKEDVSPISRAPALHGPVRCTRRSSRPTRRSWRRWRDRGEEGDPAGRPGFA